jgi:hypothetical protein
MKLTFAALPLIAFGLAAADTPVVVNNTVKNPVPVLVQAPHETFTFSKEILNPTGSGLIEYTLFTVPAGKKLVIESIAVRTRGPGLFDLKLRYSAPQIQSFVIPLTMWPYQNPLASEGLILSGLHNVRMYVASNQAVRLQMVGGMPLPAPNQNSPTFIDFAISGHLVDEI